MPTRPPLLAVLLLLACAQVPAPPPRPKPDLMAAMIEETRRERVAAARVADPIEELLLWARYYVDPELHGPLGLTREALAASPPMPLAAQVDLRRSASSLAGAAEACLPVLAWTDPAGHPRRTRRETWAALTVAPDGGVTDVVVRSEGVETVEAALRCAASAVTRWSFPAPASGGRAWVPLTARGPEVARTTPVPGLEFVPPITKPSVKPANCVGWSVRLPRDAQGLYSSMVVQFAVDKAGVPGRFKMLTPADLPLDVVAAIERGVQQCEWTPARDGNGEPITVWVVQPIRFSTD